MIRPGVTVCATVVLTVTTFPDREMAETLYAAWVIVLEASNQRPFCASPPPFADSFKLKSTSSTEQPLQPSISTIVPKFGPYQSRVVPLPLNPFCPRSRTPSELLPS